MPAIRVKPTITKPKKAVLNAAAPVQKAPQGPQEAPKHVNVELVGAKSYATLKGSYERGTVYQVPFSEWLRLDREVNDSTGEKLFVLRTNSRATAIVPDTIDSPHGELTKGTGITITHNEPPKLTRKALKEMGLERWGNDLNVEKDTGAAMATGEADIEGEGDGHDGLDISEEEALAAVPRRGPRNAAVKASLPFNPAPVRAVAAAEGDEIQV